MKGIACVSLTRVERSLNAGGHQEETTEEYFVSIRVMLVLYCRF